MEKQQIVAETRNEMYDYDLQLDVGSSAVQVRSALPRREREELALSLASSLLVFDEEKGMAYEGYNADLLEAMYILKHYTNIDVSPSDTADGRYELYDILESHCVLTLIPAHVQEDFQKVLRIYDRIHEASKQTFETSHSLSHMLKATLGSLLGNEDLAESIAKAEGINSSMIDMLGALRRENSQGKLTAFAKRNVEKPGVSD